MPHGGVGRPRGRLHRLRAFSHFVQLVPRPPLPDLPKFEARGVGRPTGVGAAPGAVFSCRFHATFGVERALFGASQVDVQPAFQMRGCDDKSLFERPEISRCEVGHDGGFAHVGAKLVAAPLPLPAGRRICTASFPAVALPSQASGKQHVRKANICFPAMPCERCSKAK